MPIRLNLLAETQAQEEMRRRDPVKRALWVAALLICLMLVWSSWLMLRTTMANKDLGKVQAQINTKTNDYQKVVDNQKKSADITARLAALRQLATHRYLNGTLLNALQQATIDDVQLARLKVTQDYLLTEETKPRTNASVVLPGKPPTLTEKIVVTLDGNDTSANPGDQVNKVKEAIAAHPYFQRLLGRTNEVSLKQFGQVQVSPDTGKSFMQFTLECRCPEVTR